MRNYKPIKIFVLVGCLVALISLVLYIPVWLDDAESRRNKITVLGLISVGQDLNAAQAALKNAGFELLYDEPITPTVSEDYLSQLVVVGNTTPNTFETFGYVAELPWMPFMHAESAYVIISADLDGIITNIK